MKRVNRQYAEDRLVLVAQEDEEFDLYIDTLEPYDTMQIQLEAISVNEEGCKKDNRIAVSKTERA